MEYKYERRPAPYRRYRRNEEITEILRRYYLGKWPQRYKTYRPWVAAHGA